MNREHGHQILSSPQSSSSGSRGNVDHRAQYGLEGRELEPSYLDYNLPKPIEIDPVSYTRSLGNFHLWDTIAVSPLGEVNASLPHIALPNKGGDGNSGRIGSQVPLLAWYNGSDGPWTGLAKGAVADSGPDHRMNPRNHFLGSRSGGYGPWIGQRPAILPDLINGPFPVPHSDSGYESRRSIECASVRSNDIADPSLDTRSLAGRSLELQPYLEGTFKFQSPPDIWGLPQSTLSASSASFFCGHCRKTVKTKSELKKHDLRHRRPFTCTFPGCTRKEGFSTANDLDRHVMSKHPETFADQRSLKSYNCLVEQCRSKDKTWFRLDNFRSHLKRMHQFSNDKIEDHLKRACRVLRIKSQESKDELKIITLDSEEERPTEKGEILESSQGHTGRSAQETLRVADLIDDQPLDSKKCIYLVNQRHCLTSHKECDEAQVLESPLMQDEQPKSDSPEPSVQDINPSSVDESGSPAVTPKSGAAKDKGEESDPGTHTYMGNGTGPPAQSDTGNESGLPVQLDAGNESGARAHLDRAKELEAPSPSALEAITLEAITALLVKAGIYQASRDTREITRDNSESLPQKAQDGIPTQTPAVQSSEKPAVGVRSRQGTPEAPLGCINEDDRNVQKLLKTMKSLGFTVKRGPKSSANRQAPRSPEEAGFKKYEECPMCPASSKFRGRPCEVRKHLKRHNRPYGCTFPLCRKRFGSKNDWKRHENSQHFQPETWQCDEGPCTKVCYHPETFRTHLTQKHKIKDVALVEQKLKTQHLSPNQQNQFWCGFCVRRVDLTRKGIEAWNERFDHIDEHLNGRRKGEAPRRIEEWVPQDREAEEEGPGSPSPSPSPSPSSPPCKPSPCKPAPLEPRIGSPQSPSSLTTQRPASAGASSSPRDVGGYGACGDSRKRRRDVEDVAASEQAAKRTKTGAVERTKVVERRVSCCRCNRDRGKTYAYTCEDCTHIHCSSCREDMVILT